MGESALKLANVILCQTHPSKSSQFLIQSLVSLSNTYLQDGGNKKYISRTMETYKLKYPS